MPSISRIAAAALLATTLSGSISWAQTSKNDEAARKQAEELKAAIAACDKGASAPLDFTAMSAPVQYAELMPYDFDTTKLKLLQGQCQAAWVGAPKEERLQLQWLRVTMSIRGDNVKLLTPQVRKLADTGSAEAQFLLYSSRAPMRPRARAMPWRSRATRPGRRCSLRRTRGIWGRSASC